MYSFLCDRSSLIVFCIFLVGLECVGHFFTYVSHFVWIRTQRPAVVSLHKLATPYLEAGTGTMYILDTLFLQKFE